MSLPLVSLALSAVCSLAGTHLIAAFTASSPPQLPSPPLPEHAETAQPLTLEEQVADLKQLRRNNADVRLCVQRLHEIGLMGTDAAVDALTIMATKLEGAQQMAAVHAIYLANTVYANQQLQILSGLRGMEGVRRQACRDLLLLGGDNLLFLRDHRLGAEKNLKIRGEVLRGLLAEGVAGLENEVLKAAKARDSVYASAGIFGVGSLRLNHGVKAVEAALESPDMQLRRDCFQALGAFGGAHSFLLLLEAYTEPNNMMFRDDITAALQQAKTSEEIEVLILRGLRDDEIEVVRIATDVIALSAPRLPELCNPALLALLDHEDLRVRELAMEGLVQAGSTAVVGTLLARLESDHPRIRSDALWALSQLGDLPLTAEARIREFTSSEDAAIRVQAANALRWFPHSDLAFAAVYALLQDESWSVRSIAAESLLEFRRTESLPGLVSLVVNEGGRVREDALHCLIEMTGENPGSSGASWQMWLDERPTFYQLPTPAKAAKLLQKIPAVVAENQQSVVRNTYHGLDLPREDLVFVLDVSGSMSSRFDQEQTYYEHFANALDETILRLPADTRFNIVLFSNSVKTWRDELVEANAENVAAAREFLANSQPGGGTNLHDALMASLAFADAQTVFLLTDGDPTMGPITAPDAILRKLQRSNRNRRVRFHTIAAGSARASFLAELALGNGGKVVDLTNVQP